MRVLDLTRLLPGPFCTLVLRRLGADVVKIEPPEGGDWVRHMSPRVGRHGALFEALHAGKRGLRLDLKKPGGATLLKRLAARAGVVVEGFRPGVMDRLGVGWEALRQENPALVYCAITGYGQDGPYAGRAGHDLNYLAIAGVLGQAPPHSPAGVPAGATPAPLPVQLADIAGGALNAVIGILAAVLSARATGQGRFVDVSMTEGALQFLLPALAEHFAGTTPGPGEGLLTGAAACYRAYRTKDGGLLAVGALEPQFWARFCGVVGRTDWSARQFDALRADSPMHDDLAALVGARTRAEWEAAFAAADACVEPALTLSELEGHPQHAARGVFLHDTGPARVQLAAVGPRLDGRPPERLPPAPAVGEHTDAVLADYGLSAAEIEGFRAAGVV